MKFEKEITYTDKIEINDKIVEGTLCNIMWCGEALSCEGCIANGMAKKMSLEEAMKFLENKGYKMVLK